MKTKRTEQRRIPTKDVIGTPERKPEFKSASELLGDDGWADIQGDIELSLKLFDCGTAARKYMRAYIIDPDRAQAIWNDLTKDNESFLPYEPQQGEEEDDDGDNLSPFQHGIQQAYEVFINYQRKNSAGTDTEWDYPQDVVFWPDMLKGLAAARHLMEQQDVPAISPADIKLLKAELADLKEKKLDPARLEVLAYAKLFDPALYEQLALPDDDVDAILEQLNEKNGHRPEHWVMTAAFIAVIAPEKRSTIQSYPIIQELRKELEASAGKNHIRASYLAEGLALIDASGIQWNDDKTFTLLPPTEQLTNTPPLPERSAV